MIEEREVLEHELSATTSSTGAGSFDGVTNNEKDRNPRRGKVRARD